MCVVPGAFSASAGRTPPSGAFEHAALFCVVVGVMPVGVGDGVAVQTGVGVGVAVPYWATEALVPELMPDTARPAPAVLNSIPATSMPRMATRDFMDCLLLREGSAALRRTRCLIASSSRSVACGRFSSKSRMTSSNSVIAH